MSLQGLLAAALSGTEGALCRRSHGMVLPVQLEFLLSRERQAAPAATEPVTMVIGQGRVIAGWRGGRSRGGNLCQGLRSQFAVGRVHGAVFQGWGE